MSRTAPQGCVTGTDYAESANTSMLVLAMIDTRTALRNLEAILAGDGSNGFYVGPSDLCLAPGQEPTFDPTAPEVLEAFCGIAARTQTAGRVAGVQCGSPATILRRSGRAFTLRPC